MAHVRALSSPEACLKIEQVRVSAEAGIFVATKIRISYHPAKRERCLAERGLDFEHAVDVFDSLLAEEEDTRADYGEVRMITLGRLRGRLAVVVWTPRDGVRHIISMRKANKREQERGRVFRFPGDAGRPD